MRKAEEILKLLEEEMPFKLVENSKSYIIEAIKLVQIEAIDETVKMCAEKAILKYADGRNMLPEYAEEPFTAVGDDLGNFNFIDRNSILNCAELLKKEL